MDPWCYFCKSIRSYNVKKKYKEKIIKINEQKGIVIDDEKENVKKKK